MITFIVAEEYANMDYTYQVLFKESKDNRVNKEKNRCKTQFRFLQEGLFYGKIAMGSQSREKKLCL